MSSIFIYSYLFIKHNAVRVVNLNPCYPSCGCYLRCTVLTKQRCLICIVQMLLLLSALYIDVTLVICVVDLTLVICVVDVTRVIRVVDVIHIVPGEGVIHALFTL